MNISKEVMNQAVAANILSKAQADALTQFIKDASRQTGFNLSNVLYYIGGLIAIGAMTLFMDLGWDVYNGFGILFLSLFYALLGIGLTHRLNKQGHKVPAGLSASFTISLIPLAIYGLQRGLGYWPYEASFYDDYHAFIHWNSFFMELGTLILGFFLLWIYPYPFMLLPLMFTLWYLALDLASLVYGQTTTLELTSLVSMGFGLTTLIIAFCLDMKARLTDYVFWLYLIGVILFWSGLSYHQSDEWSRFLYLCTNLMMIWFGVVLNRKVFVVFGALGLGVYLSYLAFQVFKGSYLFPVILSSIGFGIIYLGILWQKNERQLAQKMRQLLPESLQALLEARD